MRTLVLALSLALALPLVPSAASADGHSCNQLRQTVINAAPAMSRNLPFGSLRCAAVSRLHLLLSLRRADSAFQMNQRIEAVFRREGLIR